MTFDVGHLHPMSVLTRWHQREGLKLKVEWLKSTCPTSRAALYKYSIESLVVRAFAQCADKGQAKVEAATKALAHLDTCQAKEQEQLPPFLMTQTLDLTDEDGVCHEWIQTHVHQKGLDWVAFDLESYSLDIEGVTLT